MATAEKSMVIANEPAVDCDVKTEQRDTEDLAELFGALVATDTQPSTQDGGDTSQSTDELKTSDNPEKASQARGDKSETASKHESIVSTYDALAAETHVNMSAEELNEGDGAGYGPNEADVDGRKSKVSVWQKISTLRSNGRRGDEEKKDASEFASHSGALRSASITFWPLVALAFVLCPVLAIPAIIFCVMSYRFMRDGVHADAVWYGLVARFAAVFALGLEIILWAIVIAVIVSHST